MIRDLFKELPEVAWLTTLLLLTLAFLILDIAMAVPEHHLGTIVDKQYKPERNSSGTGVGMAGGKTAVVYSSSHESEAFLMMVKTYDGHVETTNCPPDLYYQKEIGDPLEFVIRQGRFTGVDWCVKGVR